jgi:hypothetical protein
LSSQKIALKELKEGCLKEEEREDKEKKGGKEREGRREEKEN